MKCYRCFHGKFWVHAVITYACGGPFVVRFQCKNCSGLIDRVIPEGHCFEIRSKNELTPVYSKQAWKKIKYYAKKWRIDQNEKLAAGLKKSSESKKET